MNENKHLNRFCCFCGRESVYSADVLYNAVTGGSVMTEGVEIALRQMCAEQNIDMNVAVRTYEQKARASLLRRMKKLTVYINEETKVNLYTYTKELVSKKTREEAVKDLYTIILTNESEIYWQLQRKGF